MEKNVGMEDMLRELREIQGSGPSKYCILGTRHCSYLHQQIIELLSYERRRRTLSADRGDVAAAATMDGPRRRESRRRRGARRG